MLVCGQNRRFFTLRDDQHKFFFLNVSVKLHSLPNSNTRRLESDINSRVIRVVNFSFEKYCIQRTTKRKMIFKSIFNFLKYET